jgi:hypothetical protein
MEDFILFLFPFDFDFSALSMLLDTMAWPGLFIEAMAHPPLVLVFWFFVCCIFFLFKALVVDLFLLFKCLLIEENLLLSIFVASLTCFLPPDRLFLVLPFPHCQLSLLFLWLLYWPYED